MPDRRTLRPQTHRFRSILLSNNILPYVWRAGGTRALTNARQGRNSAGQDASWPFLLPFSERIRKIDYCTTECSLSLIPDVAMAVKGASVIHQNRSVAPSTSLREAFVCVTFRPTAQRHRNSGVVAPLFRLLQARTARHHHIFRFRLPGSSG